MNRPSTPRLGHHDTEKEESTSSKAAVKAVVDFNEAHGTKYTKTKLFKALRRCIAH